MIVLRQAEKQRELMDSGYTIMDFLPDETLSRLRAYGHEHFNSIPQAFFASSHLPDIALRRAANDTVLEHIQPLIPAILEGGKLLGGSFLIKREGKNSALQAHQDWNIVDEENFCSYNLWVPLVDVDESNGTLAVLPGSHLIGMTYRGPGLPSPLAHLEKKLLKHLQPLTVKAGQVVLYDHRLIHGSPPNQVKNNLRSVVVAGLIPEEAEMICCIKNDNFIGIYNSYPDFYISNNPSEGPGTLKLLKRLEKLPPPISSKKVLPVKRGLMSLLESFIGTGKRLTGQGKDLVDLEPINFLEVEASQMPVLHPAAFDELFHSKKHGFLIRNFLSRDELQSLQAYANENKNRNPARTPVGYTFPMVFQEFSLRNQQLKRDDLEKSMDEYFSGNSQYAELLAKECGVDLKAKLLAFFDSLSPNGPVHIPLPESKRGAYLFGNFRHLEPTGGYMAVHCGNFFHKKFPLIYSDLCKDAEVKNQMSYFIMLQKPDVGGELSVFNMRWIDGQDKETLSEDEVILLSNGQKVKVDYHPSIVKQSIVPEPGDMILFQGGNIWHRVEKVSGSKERITFGGFIGKNKDSAGYCFWT